MWQRKIKPDFGRVFCQFVVFGGFRNVLPDLIQKLLFDGFEISVKFLYPDFQFKINLITRFEAFKTGQFIVEAIFQNLQFLTCFCKLIVKFVKLALIKRFQVRRFKHFQQPFESFLPVFD